MTKVAYAVRASRARRAGLAGKGVREVGWRKRGADSGGWLVLCDGVQSHLHLASPRCSSGRGYRSVETEPRLGDIRDCPARSPQAPWTHPSDNMHLSLAPSRTCIHCMSLQRPKRRPAISTLPLVPARYWHPHPDPLGRRSGDPARPALGPCSVNFSRELGTRGGASHRDGLCGSVGHTRLFEYFIWSRLFELWDTVDLSVYPRTAVSLSHRLRPTTRAKARSRYAYSGPTVRSVSQRNAA